MLASSRGVMVRISDILENTVLEEEVASSEPPIFFVVEEVESARAQTPRQPAAPAATAPIRASASRAARSAAHAAGSPLDAAKVLLRHPPPPGASPSAMQQWRNDVERLILAAENTPSSARAGSRPPLPPSGGRPARRGPETAAASVRSPTVRGAETKDLRAELNRRRAGTHTTTVQQPRAQPNVVKGKNLDNEFAAAVPQPLACAQVPGVARSPPGASSVGAGCAALADGLRQARWPAKFRPHLPEKYDGNTNPSEFLQVYATAILAVGGDDAVMASYFHVALSGPAWTWLMNLAPGSVHSWGKLCAQFTANFASACQQYGVEAHLHAVRQKPGETLRAFIARFTKV